MLIVKQQLDLPYKFYFPVVIFLSIYKIFVERKISSYHLGKQNFWYKSNCHMVIYILKYMLIHTHTHIYIYICIYLRFFPFISNHLNYFIQTLVRMSVFFLSTSIQSAVFKSIEQGLKKWSFQKKNPKKLGQIQLYYLKMANLLKIGR